VQGRGIDGREGSDVERGRRSVDLPTLMAGLEAERRRWVRTLATFATARPTAAQTPSWREVAPWCHRPKSRPQAALRWRYADRVPVAVPTSEVEFWAARYASADDTVVEAIGERPDSAAGTPGTSSSP